MNIMNDGVTRGIRSTSLVLAITLGGLLSASSCTLLHNAIRRMEALAHRKDAIASSMPRATGHTTHAAQHQQAQLASAAFDYRQLTCGEMALTPDAQVCSKQTQRAVNGAHSNGQHAICFTARAVDRQ